MLLLGIQNSARAVPASYRLLHLGEVCRDVVPASADPKSVPVWKSPFLVAKVLSPMLI